MYAGILCTARVPRPCSAIWRSGQGVGLHLLCLCATTAAKRILREIKLLRHFGSHENIINITDIMTGPPDTKNFSDLYIVSELWECDLQRIVSSAQTLTDQHYQYFVYQILRGLKYIHSANVLHRYVRAGGAGLQAFDPGGALAHP